MAVDGGYGPRGGPRFLDGGAPDLATDDNEVSKYAELVGNRMVGTKAQKDALVRTTSSGNSPAQLWEGLEFEETDTGILWKRKSGSWVGGTMVPTRLDATVSTQGTITQHGFAFARGGNGPQLSIPITFPIAFGSLPTVTVSEAGYRTSATFNPEGLSTYIGTTWCAMGPSKTSFTATGQGTGNYVNTNWYYVQWIAVGAV